MKRRTYLAATATTAAAGLAGCLGGNDSGNPDTSQGGGGLESRAREEETLTLYSVIDKPAMTKTVLPAFKKDYPWAETEVLGLSPAQIASKMSSEYRAGQVQTDVAWNTQTAMTALISQGVFRKVTEIAPLMNQIHAMNYPDSFYADYWSPGIQNPQTAIYNTKALAADEVPDSFEGWTDSRWQGKLIFDHPELLNVAGGEFTSLYGQLEKSQWQRIMEGIAANQPTLTQSASETFRRVAAGSGQLGIGIINNYIVGQRQENPPAVEIKWVDPNVSLNVPLYLAKDALHPNMAVLFARWIASLSGQVASAKTGNTPVQPVLAQATFAQYIPDNIELKPVAHDVPSYFGKPTQWSERYGQLFG